MPAFKSITLATAALGLAASAHAAGDFAFQYAFDREALATPAGAEKVLSDLEERIREECHFSRITERYSFARTMTETCVAESLKDAVRAIDAPHLDAAYERRQASRS